MARTGSEMVELGTGAPAFELQDVVSGRVMRRDDIFAATREPGEGVPANGMHTGPHGLLVMFVCVHCPYVKHVEEELARLGEDYEGRIAIVAISSNDIAAFPVDAPAEMKRQAERLGWRFPYLFDETQEIARSYGAACTPDFFLYDRGLQLVYRGQLDGSRPASRSEEGSIATPVTGADLRRAMDDVIAGREPDRDQRGSIGCNIKWKP